MSERENQFGDAFYRATPTQYIEELDKQLESLTMASYFAAQGETIAFMKRANAVLDKMMHDQSKRNNNLNMMDLVRNCLNTEVLRSDFFPEYKVGTEMLELS